MAESPVPARIFGIKARSAARVVLFRQGPHRQVQQLLWDLETDEITPGQWLKHRIYPRRCDLSLDAAHLLYFAAPYKAPVSSYTAISRPPFFTATTLVPHGGAWNGGGVFLDGRRFWVDRGGMAEHPDDTWRAPDAEAQLTRVMDRPDSVPQEHGEDMVLYPARLKRDGWAFGGQTFEKVSRYGAHRWRFSRALEGGTVLEKTVTASLEDRGPTGQIYWETHHLSGQAGDRLALHDSWAEADGAEVVFGREGCVWCWTPDGATTEIADLTPNRFTPVEAPYTGLKRGRQTGGQPWHPLDGDDT